MKRTFNNHQENYLNWRASVADGIPELGKYNSYILLRFLSDMELGRNTGQGTVKGPRSYVRLMSLRDKLLFIIRKTTKPYSLDMITDISEEQLLRFFNMMKDGTIQKVKGGRYRSTPDFIRDFKTFWHWYQKIKHQDGDSIYDITQYLDTRKETPDWVYLTEEQFEELCDNAKPEYRRIFQFLLDTGARSPSESFNVRVSDFNEDYTEVNIRDEVAKTFGRKIKLRNSAKSIRDHIKQSGLSGDDYLINFNYHSFNRYLKKLATKLFGHGKSPAGKKYSEMTVYHIRHIACCYWLPKYENRSVLMYKFGWLKEDKIHYYSRFLGISDTISSDNEKKNELVLQNENDSLKQQVSILESKFNHISELLNKMSNNSMSFSGKES